MMIKRSSLIKLLRKVHLWVGLWAALLALFFGLTGFLLNHRSVLKIPAAQTQESSIELAWPSPAPANARELADWISRELKLDQPAQRVRSEAAKPVPWGDKTHQQPAHWMISFVSPASQVQADYWVGNAYITVKRTDNNVFAMLNAVHKGGGLGVWWILLADSLAVSLVILSLTGMWLWVLMRKRR